MTNHVDVHMHIPSVAEYKLMVERCRAQNKVDLSGNHSDGGAMASDDKQVGGTHYMTMPIQPWEVMEAVLTAEEFRGFLKGSIIKYSMRAGKKEGTDDEAKARHYKDKLRETAGWVGW